MFLGVAVQEYADRGSLVGEIEKTAAAFIKEFADIAEADKDARRDDVDKTPQEMIAYNLGWMDLIRGWDRVELSGKTAVTPAPGYKWNQMGALHKDFYEKHRGKSLGQLTKLFADAVASLVEWLKGFSNEELFEPGGRKWASSTSSNWPIWKWVHINTVAPFKSFRGKIRKWKKAGG
jgi:hypothetical protein